MAATDIALCSFAQRKACFEHLVLPPRVEGLQPEAEPIPCADHPPALPRSKQAIALELVDRCNLQGDILKAKQELVG